MKTAIITGASKGIGLATAKALQQKGYKVAGWSRSASSLEPSDSYKHFSVDITKSEEVSTTYMATLEFLGHVDVLINNAGLGFEGRMEEMPDEEWTKMFDLNVHGLFYCTKNVVPGMKERKSGHILNISSVAGKTGIPGMAGYCGTKYAVSGISNALMKEVRKYGIKVTCIYPGAVETNFFDDINSVEANDTMVSPDQIAETIAHCVDSPPNLHHVDVDIRPLMNKVTKD